jgi:hypothetical protein
MAELAEHPSSARARSPTRWIGGAAVAGESGRSGPVFNPPTGEQT